MHEPPKRAAFCGLMKNAATWSGKLILARSMSPALPDEFLLRDREFDDHFEWQLAQLGQAHAGLRTDCRVLPPEAI